MLTFYKIPDSLLSEIKEFEKSIESFKQETLNPVKFRAIRVPFGVYEQRTVNTYMVRIRCAAGGITPVQLAKVAECAKTYASGRIHLTTRQEVQIHDVQLDRIIPIIKDLLSAGLSSRGGGGNTVRNIMASVDSGINADEVFDITPYAIALTSQLISEPDSWNLPRKYKITFCNGPIDNANVTMQDLGFVARVKNNRKGFQVFVAGGMGAKPMAGQLLYDFVPEDKVYPIAAALKRLFDKHGNRKNKHAARLRFLWQSLGKEEFIRLFEEELNAVEKEHPVLLPIEKVEHILSVRTFSDILQRKQQKISDTVQRWRNNYVNEQKQKGLFSIKVPLPLGDISSEQAAQLARLIEPFGENVLRCSMDQNFHIRNIPEACLDDIYQGISQITLLATQPAVLSNIIACAGASTCKLGICLPRGAVSEIYKRISVETHCNASLPRIHLSGCPNSCGQHWTADLGFFGKAGRKDGRAYPAYNICVGARLVPGDTRMAETIGDINARDLPSLVEDILNDYDRWAAENGNKVQQATFRDYLAGEGKEHIQNRCDYYQQQLPIFNQDRNYYYDWDAEAVFSIEKLGQGECTAGLFDMIEVDIKLIKEAKVNNNLKQIIFSSARMLLVTKGIDTQTDTDVYKQFQKAFIKTGLISDTYSHAIEKAASGDDLQSLEKDVIGLSDAVIALYESMDNSLRFPGETDSTNVKQLTVETQNITSPQNERQSKEETITPDKSKDYRGVTCPMNFVKTKLDLTPMQSGQILEILLDDGEPIENVPRSVEGEGHTILAQTMIDNYWRVVIKKG